MACGAIVAAVVAGPGSTADAAPDERASCVAELTVFNTGHPEVFGSRADVAHQLKADADAVSPGSSVTTIAARTTSIDDCV